MTPTKKQLVLIRKLAALAVNKAATLEEKRTAALKACMIGAEIGLMNYLDKLIAENEKLIAIINRSKLFR